MKKDMIKGMTSIYVTQDEIYFSVRVKNETIDKMNEIRRRNPEEDWDKRGLELICKANDELKAEKAKKN